MLTEDLYAHARTREQDAALLYGDEVVTWAQLLDRVERAAAGLTAEGIAAGDAVALLLPNSPAFVVGFLAVTGLGAVAVPLNPAFKPGELAFYFEDSGVRAVLGDAPPGVPSLSVDALVEAHAGAPLAPRAPEEALVYGYSSGTTGRPKRVARTHGECWAEADSYRASVEITATDTLFCAVPLFHSYGMGSCLATFVRTGATLVVMEEANPFILHRRRALELLERHRVTIFPGVPFHFRLLAEMEADPPDLSALRLCTSAGTPLPAESFRRFLDRFGIAVRQNYGSTESGVMTINVDPDPVATHASAGTAVAGVELVVLGDTGEPLAPGEEGEIAVRGPAVAAGYADQPELSAERFRDGLYLTGDSGRMDAEGHLFITGRTKAFIAVAGYKVDPVEVEGVLMEHPKVREAVVVGVPGKADGEEIVKAAIVAGDSCEQRELVAFCQERLANFKVPRIVEFRDEIPKSPLGKVLRKYLIE